MPTSLTKDFFHAPGRSAAARLGLTGCALLCCTLSATASTTQHVKTGTTQPSVKHKLRRSSHSSLRHSEAPAIAAERATQIQTALIQKGYLSGEPTGNWDAQTVAAMQRLQADNGWQSKITPDARALIKLGLGPAPAASATGATLSSPQR
jgi:peptidoglycan hydrolase-like protein with peptidoglycan-binding domain